MGEYKYKIEFELEQQTPMLHFQHDQKGATLRASEVKPKLDKFLLKILEKFGLENEAKNQNDEKDKKDKKDSIVPNTWLVGNGEHPALNYKMQIVASGESRKSKDIEDFIYDKIYNTKRTREKYELIVPKSFFGNMVDLRNGKNEEDKKNLVRKAFKELVLYKSSIKITIICFNNELLNFIDMHICSFFLINNFGTRQNKGFGSFKIIKKDKKEYCYNIEEEIKKGFDKTFFVIKKCSDTPLNDICKIYQYMKTGVNFKNTYFRAYIYQYFHCKNIGNEKAWMKKTGIAPITGKEKNISKHEHIESKNDFKYVRAMLGLCDRLSYINKVVNGKMDKYSEKTNVIISDKQNDIMRFASPIYFKVIDKKIYILPLEVNPVMYNKDFCFSSNKNSETIKTPKFFDTVDFVDEFFKKYNEENKKNKYEIEKIKVGDEKKCLNI